MLKERFITIKNNLDSVTWREFLIRLILVLIGSSSISTLTKYISQVASFEAWIENIIYYLLYIFYVFWIVNWIIEKFNRNIFSSPSAFFTSVSKFCFSSKDNEEVFKPIVTDWQEEYFEALFKKEIWKARWINVRYTYAFLAAMWQKSPIGDLIEFVIKIAKP